ncbi:MAG TPA: hypothetical protein VKX45_16885 [Bryobacteraceae bacterium]|jgi:hypothetical protein|nr:hypothetical protein [Bryobacteraceae bacterium]
MRWNPDAYGPEIAAILALDGNGERLMALAEPRCVSEDARARIALAPVPETLRAGLYLYFGCWTDAHEAAQAIDTREGSYWHAIVHRQEPDAGNSAYWFGQVGSHPIYPELAQLANEPGLMPWNPRKFIEYCDRARREPGSELERRAHELQRLEWQLLFDYCAKGAGMRS